MLTFVVANLVSQYDHAFSEQLVLKVLGEERAQLSLQQLPAKHTDVSQSMEQCASLRMLPKKIMNQTEKGFLENCSVFKQQQVQERRKDVEHTEQRRFRKQSKETTSQQCVSLLRHPDVSRKNK